MLLPSPLYIVILLFLLRFLRRLFSDELLVVCIVYI
jgi:hypothetical protein